MKDEENTSKFQKETYINVSSSSKEGTIKDDKNGQNAFNNISIHQDKLNNNKRKSIREIDFACYDLE